MKNTMYFLRAATSLLAGALLATAVSAQDNGEVLPRGLSKDPAVRYAGFQPRVGTFAPSDKPAYWNFDVTNRADAQDAYWNVYMAACATPLTFQDDGNSSTAWRQAYLSAINYTLYVFSGADRVRYMVEDLPGDVPDDQYNLTYAPGFTPRTGDTVTTDSNGVQWVSPLILQSDVTHAAQSLVQTNVISHFIDQALPGVLPRDNWVLESSSLTGGSAKGKTIDYLLESFLVDSGSGNAIAGHRLNMIAGGYQWINIGDAVDSSGSVQQANVLFEHFHADSSQSAPDSMSMLDPWGTARPWPYAGYVPVNLLTDRTGQKEAFIRFSLSFGDEFKAYKVSPDSVHVTVLKNGTAVPVLAVRAGYWQRDLVYDVQVGDLSGDPKFEVTIDGIRFTSAVAGMDWILAPSSLLPRTYKYSFTVFDPAVVKSDGYAVQTGGIQNISTRSYVGNGDRVLVTGVIVDGTEPLRVAFRAQGQSLKKYGVSGCATNPKMDLYQIVSGGSNKVLGTVDDWKQSANWRLIQSYNLNPSEDQDCAMVATLMPGAYTAVVSAPQGGEGVGIIEAFNIDSHSSSKLTNISTRGVIGDGDKTMIAGLILATETTVVIRTQSPGLTKYGISDVVSDTTVELVRLNDDGTNTTIASNDDWKADPANARLQSDLVGYAPSDDREAALVIKLPAGRYTPMVRAKGGQTGVGIVEIFKINTN